MSGEDWYLDFLKGLLPKMEALENSLSIIIQGPLNTRMKESIPHYLKVVKNRQYFSKALHGNELSKDKMLGNLIISCWENDDFSIIEEFKNYPNIKIVINKYSNLPKYEKRLGTRGASPWMFQNYTTKNGLSEATGNLSIKVRSDEVYTNLEYFTKRMFLEYGKIFTSDIFFRRDAEEKFHISDHVIGGPTCTMKSAFQNAVHMCQNPYSEGVKFPEQLICRAFLKTKNEDLSKTYKSKEMMKRNFRIIPITRLGEITWTCSYRRYRPLKSQEDGWLQDINQI